MTNTAQPCEASYSKLDMLPWVDMSYATWDVSDKRREAFLRQRREFGVSDFDSYNVADSVAGLLANTLILASRNEILPDEDTWRKINTHLVSVLPIEEEVFNAVTLLSYFATDSEATYAIQGKEKIEHAFLVAFAILPMLKDPDATTEYLSDELKKAYRESRCVHMVCQLDMVDLGYYVIHMISSLLINLANNYHSVPADYAQSADRWETLLREAAFNFTRREFMPDNSIPTSAQDFFLSHLGSLWD